MTEKCYSFSECREKKHLLSINHRSLQYFNHSDLNHWIIFVLLLFSSISCSQNHSPTWHAVIIDSASFQPVPFVRIQHRQQHTLSDFNGAFSVQQLTNNDTITFSLIGYDLKNIIYQSNHLLDTVYLQPKVIEMDEVIILTDNSILYRLLSNLVNTQPQQRTSAKAYFELETFHDQQQLELFQGYYNGYFKGVDVEELKMKTGRFALAPISKRIFASTETSKALSQFQLFQHNAFFPISPFELNERTLRKRYQLYLTAKYTNENQHVIYLIQFEPKQDSEHYFGGKVWIDFTANALQKVELTIQNTAIHPFLSIWPTDTIEHVCMEISKSFNDNRVETIDFNYHYNYRALDDSLLHLSTRAVLHAFDYTSTFELPIFDFPKTTNEDYRKIQMLPANEAFWNCYDAFTIPNNSFKQSFLTDPQTIKPQLLFHTDSLFKRNFLENPYLTWNGNRILMKGLTADSTAYYDQHQVLNSDRYKLNVQLLVDRTEGCNGIQLITQTVFDPYKSYYHFEISRENQVFINIYFDLMEIDRRRLAIELEKVKTDEAAINELYSITMKKVASWSTVYFKETQRGTNKIALKKWNDLVKEELGIDNFDLFNMYEK